MNIDPTGLEEFAKPDIEDGGKHYKDAYDVLKSIDLPSGANTRYKDMINNIFINIESLMTELVGDIDKYISDLKEANVNTKNEVESQNFSQNGNVSIDNSGTEDEEKNPIEQFFSAGKESFRKFFGMLFNSEEQNDADVKGNIEAAAEEIVTSTMTEEEVKDFLAGSGGALVNGGVAAIDGVASLGENVWDFLVMTSAYQTRQDIESTAVWNEMFGNNDGAEELRKTADASIEASMEFVEKDHVEAGLDLLYSQAFMQKINEGAYIKRGDNVYMVIEGITYYVPITAMEAVLPGAGTAVSFMAGTGKADAEYLTQMKLNSKDGITSEYQDGKISKDTYEFYNNVWNMSDEEFQSICMKKITGEITDEQFEYIENIRNMPDEWATVENANKAMAGGGMTGAWEATQWAAGVKLNGLKTLFGSKGVASAFRIGADTAFNSADTAYRALVDTMVFDKEFGEAFEDRGGYAATGINGVVGLIGSGIGEVIDFNSTQKPSVESSNVDTKLDMKTGQETFAASSTDGGMERVNDGNFSYKLMGEGDNQSAIAGTETYKNVGKGKELMLDFFEKHPEAGISKEQVEAAFEAINIFETDEGFEDLLRVKTTLKENELKQIGAFADDEKGDIYLRPNNDTPTVVHEVNHVLGVVLNSEGKVDIGAGRYTGMNEAFTELLARRITETQFQLASYGVTASRVNKMIEVLEERGYKDLATSTYYNGSSNRNAFQDALRDVMGNDELYEEMVDFANIANRPGYLLDPKKNEAEIMFNQKYLEFMSQVGGT